MKFNKLKFLIIQRSFPVDLFEITSLNSNDQSNNDLLKIIILQVSIETDMGKDTISFCCNPCIFVSE